MTPPRHFTELLSLRNSPVRTTLAAIVIPLIGPPASAALIPYYRMDSLAFMASDVVLCD